MAELHEDRAEHLRLCKLRALDYLDAGDLPNALASMVSDLSKHPGTAETPKAWIMLGMGFVINGDADQLRQWIEGFQ